MKEERREAPARGPTIRRPPHTIITLSLALLLCAQLVQGKFALIKESNKRECFDAVCDRDCFKDPIFPVKLYEEDEKTVKECRACQQCTDNGFSVCAEPKTFRGETLKSDGACACGHSMPDACTVVTDLEEYKETASKERQKSKRLFRICYLPVLQKPPAVQAINEPKDVIATIEPFWFTDYWRALKPTNLTLHYDFRLEDTEHCVSRSSSDSREFTPGFISLKRTDPYNCKQKLKIEMYTSDDKQMDNEEQFKQNVEDFEAHDGTSPAAYGDDNNELPPEIQFERDVFDGSEDAMFYYTFIVVRPGQPKPGSGSNYQFQNTTTIVTSEELKFDLEQGKYGSSSRQSDQPKKKTEKKPQPIVKPVVGMQKEPPPPGHGKITKVPIEEHTSSERPVTSQSIVRPTHSSLNRKKFLATLYSTSSEDVSLATKKQNPSATKDTTTPDPSRSIRPPNDPPTEPATEESGLIHEILNGGGQFELVRNVFLITISLCLLLVVLTICFRKRLFTCCKKSGQNEKRSMNGKEYQPAAAAEK